MTAMRELSGRSAIVTGGAAAKAIAVRLAAAGARVALAVDGGAETLADIHAAGGEAFAEPGRPTAEADWERLANRAVSAFGGLDIAAFAANAFEPRPSHDLGAADFNHLARGGLKAAFFCVKHAAVAMRKTGRGGTILLVGDLAARLGLGDGLHHAAVQGGLRMLVKSAALELGPEGVRVNAVLAGAPGGHRVGATPLGRDLAPGDVAGAALFLASDRSRFMTGAEIVLDGGWSIQ